MHIMYAKLKRILIRREFSMPLVNYIYVECPRHPNRNIRHTYEKNKRKYLITIIWIRSVASIDIMSNQ